MGEDGLLTIAGQDFDDSVCLNVVIVGYIVVVGVVLVVALAIVLVACDVVDIDMGVIVCGVVEDDASTLFSAVKTRKNEERRST